MRIGLIDADLMDQGTRHPNLALMKISGYFKEQGNEVELIYHSYSQANNYEEVYMSKVFTFTDVPEWVLELPNLHIGGTGFYEDGGENLIEEIEHHMPDYDLYKDFVNERLEKGEKRHKFSDYLDYSIGFATRGCFRKCAFCVNKKYDNVFRHALLTEFYNENKPYIYLWDDNFLAYSKWEDLLDELEAIGKPFQFRQGIDLRLMTDRKAYRFNNTHYHGDFIFAFDHLKDESVIVRNVQLWKRYSSRICKMYVLSGYDSQDEKDIASVFERISILMKYGSLPYIMRYEAYKTSRFKNIYIELARWCNQPQFFKKKSFREFCIANQEYKKNQETNCSAYQAMLDFEKEFPQIAKCYYDLKFEEENIYSSQYGYGRKYLNKLECSDCRKKGKCWENLVSDKEDEKILALYFTKEIDLLCLDYKNAECKMDSLKVSRYLLDLIMKTTIVEIIEAISNASEREVVSKENIPQYSKVEDAYKKVPSILRKLKDKDVTYEMIGYYLEKDDNPDKKSEIALKKYGENHTKLACLLDLAHISKKGVRSNIYITKMGELFNTLSVKDKNLTYVKLSLRIPILQNKLIEGENIDTIKRDISVLSKETQKRRGSNVLNMVRSILRHITN